MITDALAGLCLLGGVAFFVAGIVGVMRFPDALCRLHAVTKADNLGLGLVVLGLVLGGGSPFVMATLVLVWLLVLTGSATTCFLVAQCIMRDESFPNGDPRPGGSPARSVHPGFPGHPSHPSHPSHPDLGRLPGGPVDPARRRDDDPAPGHDDGGTG